MLNAPLANSGRLQILWSANVEPWLMHWIYYRAFGAGQQSFKNCWNVTGFTRLEQLEYTRIEYIDSRVDMAAKNRFLFETHDVNPVRVHNAEGVLQVVRSHSHCASCSMSFVKIQNFAVPQIRQYVRV